MRNDARPIGEHSPGSPIGGDESPLDSERTDKRDSVKDDRQSHIINREADEPRGDDSVTPSSDSTGK
jgi:hypothetical protein